MKGNVFFVASGYYIFDKTKSLKFQFCFFSKAKECRRREKLSLLLFLKKISLKNIAGEKGSIWTPDRQEVDGKDRVCENIIGNRRDARMDKTISKKLI